MKGKVKNLNGNLLRDVPPQTGKKERSARVRVQRSTPSGRLQPGPLEDHQISGRVFEGTSQRWPTWLARHTLSLSLCLSSLELCPPSRPFREWSCKLLPPFQAKRDRKAVHRTLRFFPFSFLSFLSSPPLLPSFLIPPSSLVAVGTTLMPTECNRRKFPLGDFSTQND